MLVRFGLSPVDFREEEFLQPAPKVSQKRKKSGSHKEPRPAKKVTIAESPTQGGGSSSATVLGVGAGGSRPEVVQMVTTVEAVPLTASQPSRSSHPTNEDPFAPKRGIRAHDTVVGDSRVARELVLGAWLDKDKGAARTTGSGTMVANAFTSFVMVQNYLSELVERFEDKSLNLDAERFKNEALEAQHTRDIGMIEDLKLQVGDLKSRLDTATSERRELRKRYDDLTKRCELEVRRLAKERKTMTEKISAQVIKDYKESQPTEASF